MSILTKSAIQREMQRGNIVITPFYENQLGPNSYDLHLGRNLYFSAGPFDVKADVSERYALEKIPDDGKWLLPGILYLGVTVEYTETHGFVPVMEGKSSLGRMGTESHICAGMGDNGFCGHWTLEIRVMAPTLVYPGMPIGQLVYHTIEGEEGLSYRETGSYNGHQSDNPMPVLPNLWKKPHQFITI